MLWACRRRGTRRIIGRAGQNRRAGILGSRSTTVEVVMMELLIHVIEVNIS